jgi:hypothetical protein
MAVLTFCVASLEQAHQALRAGGIRPASADSSRIRIAPSDAFNVTLEFEAQETPSEKAST